MMVPDILAVEPYDVGRLWTGSAKIVIVGDPMTGKSELLRHLTAMTPEDVTWFDGCASAIPMLRDTPGVVIATVETKYYWTADTQLDPDVVFVFAPSSSHTRDRLTAVFVNVLPKSLIHTYFQQMDPFECLVVDFRARGNAESSCVFKYSFKK